MFKRIFRKSLDKEIEEYNENEEYELDSYNNEEANINIEYEEYDNAEEENKKLPTKTSIKKIINIVFIILILAMLMISIDVICVARYNKGPFFAIRTNVYTDGGTKVYYGLGYKVIKYNQVQGRRDTKIGFWTMPYSVEATTISVIDLAIEFGNHPEKTYKKYYKEFLRIEGKVQKIDNENKKITIGYIDEDGKYTLNVVCEMADDNIELSKFNQNDNITVIGTVSKFALKTEKKQNTLYVSNCFAQ